MERKDTAPDSHDLMDRLLASDTYSPVQKVANIPDPDAALEQLLHTPGVTQADIEFARDWVPKHKARILAEATKHIEDRREKIAAKAVEVDDRIFAINQRAQEITDAVRKVDYDSVRSVAGELKSLRMEMDHLERLIEGLEARERSTDALAENPVEAYFDLYRRFPSLAANIQTLWQALSDDRDSKTRPALRHTSF